MTRTAKMEENCGNDFTSPGFVAACFFFCTKRRLMGSQWKLPTRVSARGCGLLPVIWSFMVKLPTCHLPLTFCGTDIVLRRESSHLSEIEWGQEEFIQIWYIILYFWNLNKCRQLKWFKSFVKKFCTPEKLRSLKRGKPVKNNLCMLKQGSIRTENTLRIWVSLLAARIRGFPPIVAV